MSAFAFQNTELINNLPKLSERDIAIVEGKLGMPVEMQTCTSFPAGSDCAFRDSDGQWYWLTDNIINKEIESRLRHKHGLVNFGAYESIFKVDSLSHTTSPSMTTKAILSTARSPMKNLTTSFSCWATHPSGR